MFTQGTISHIDSSDEQGAERWRQLAQRIIPELHGAMEPALCDGTSMNAVTPRGHTTPSRIAPRCRWLGALPIHRQDDTDVRRVFLAAGETDTVGTLTIWACGRTFTATGEAMARMITTAKLATRTGAVLA